MLVKFRPTASSIFSDLENTFLGSWFDNDYPTVDFNPKVDVVEHKDNYTLRADLPGVSKDDVKLSLENQVLSLSGEKRRDKETKEESYRLRETSYGKFERRFRLSDDVDSKNIQANFKDGILEVSLPKSKEARAKEISINVS